MEKAVVGDNISIKRYNIISIRYNIISIKRYNIIYCP